jgi:beta-phosphoglucomutase-like phosphatase (HAD superfamily)
MRFDLDGVLTDTASVHRKAWKAMFDDFLRQWSEHSGTKFVAFDADADYFTYVDGPTAQTASGLGHRKDKTFLHSVDTDGVKVFEGSRRYL